MEELKQAIVLKKDLSLSKGKAIAQGCHASLNAFLSSDEDIRSEWLNKGGKKVVLSSGDRDVKNLYQKAERNKISASIVKDAGHTEVDPGTITAIGIGPAPKSKIDRITGELELVQ